MITLDHVLVVAAILFVIGMVGVITRRNLIVMFMSIEIMINAVGLMFAAFSVIHNQLDGMIFVLMLITVAASESAIGLALIVMIYKKYKTVNVDEMRKLNH
jgi:NADH-quinone oxidoreductase subunit K